MTHLKSLGQPSTQVTQTEEAREGGPAVTPAAVGAFVSLVDKLVPLGYCRYDSISYT